MYNESAHIARGNVKSLQTAVCSNFDAIILPGGFDMAKNLSDIAAGGNNVSTDLALLLESFLKAKKLIGAICIALAVIVAALGKKSKNNATLGIATLGIDENNSIEVLGGYYKDGPPQINIS